MINAVIIGFSHMHVNEIALYISELDTMELLAISEVPSKGAEEVPPLRYTPKWNLVLSIQGTPKKIIPLNKCSGMDGATGQDFGMAVLEYENGVSFVKTSAVERGGFERRQLVVSGTKKTVELRPLEMYVEKDNLVTERYVRESENWRSVTEKEQSEPRNRYDAMMQSFAQMIRGEKENPWDYDYELKLYKTVLECCGEKR